MRLFLASLQVLIGIDTLIILVPPERNQSTRACCAWFQLNVVNYSVLHLQLTVLLKVGLSATGLHTYAINVHNHAAHSIPYPALMSFAHCYSITTSHRNCKWVLNFLEPTSSSSSSNGRRRRHRSLTPPPVTLPCVNKNFFFPFFLPFVRDVPFLENVKFLFTQYSFYIIHFLVSAYLFAI